jgi:hypothetical protein
MKSCRSKHHAQKQHCFTATDCGNARTLQLAHIKQTSVQAAADLYTPCPPTPLREPCPLTWLHSPHVWVTCSSSSTTWPHGYGHCCTQVPRVLTGPVGDCCCRLVRLQHQHRSKNKCTNDCEEEGRRADVKCLSWICSCRRAGVPHVTCRWSQIPSAAASPSTQHPCSSSKHIIPNRTYYTNPNSPAYARSLAAG